MNVGIFCLKENEDSLLEIEECFKEKNIEYSLFKIGKNWENVNGDELLFHLNNITHGILIPLDVGIKSRWFSYFVGFLQGKELQGCIYNKESMPIPKYVKYPIVSSTEELLLFVEDELRTWQESAQIEECRQNLINLGIAITVENLFDCVDRGDLQSIKNFLKVGFTVNELSDKGTPLLIHAIRKRQHNIVDFLLENSDINVNLLSKDRGSSALMEACAENNNDLVTNLLRLGADSNLQNLTGQTALIISLNNSNVNLVKMLLENDADVSIKDNMEMDAIGYAELFGMDEIVEIIEQQI